MDLRIIKTQKAIREAFIDLLVVKDYDDITIQDILQKALINRATFYKYYSGKSDLAGQMIDEFKEKIQQLLNDRLNTDTPCLDNIMEQHSQDLFQYRKQILALWKIRTKRHNLYDDMFNMIKQNFINLVQARSTNNLPKNLDYQATIMATIIMVSIQYYYEKDMPIPKEMHDDWQQMIDMSKI